MSGTQATTHEHTKCNCKKIDRTFNVTFDKTTYDLTEEEYRNCQELTEKVYVAQRDLEDHVKMIGLTTSIKKIKK
jgi:hypothetical protein